MDIDAAFLFANAVFTLACGGTIVYLLQIKKLKRHYLFYFWALAFLFYGAEITFRALSAINLVPYNADVVGVLLYPAFLLFPVGLWSLSHRKQIFYVLIPAYVLDFLFYALFVWKIVPQEFAFVAIHFFFYLPVIVTLLDHRRLFGKSLDRLIIGWLLLFLANLLMPDESWILDVLNIFAKAVIILGMTDYDFAISVKNIRERMVQQAPPASSRTLKEGGFEVVKYVAEGHKENIEWMKRKIDENVTKDIRSYIFSFQDTIQHETLRSLKSICPEKVSILLFSATSPQQGSEFAVLPMGLTEVGAALSEITQSNLNSQNGCDVFLTNFSLLIHAFGPYPCYNMILNKMGEIRQANVMLYAFVSPETHNDSTVVSLFTNISDKVIEL